MFILERPVIFYDLETTGTDVKSCRIVSIHMLEIRPDGDPGSEFGSLVNPGIPIPEEASKVHGITDEHVMEAPSFAAIAGSVLGMIANADLAGFNVKRFDVPVLARHLMECGRPFRIADHRILDVAQIFHDLHPRTLSAAVRTYLGCDHDGAHAADADVRATFDVFRAILHRHGDLPRTMAELHRKYQTDDPIDAAGVFVRRGDDLEFTIGKHKGKNLSEVRRNHPDYLNWILRSDFLPDVQDLVRRALNTKDGLFIVD